MAGGGGSNNQGTDLWLNLVVEPPTKTRPHMQTSPSCNMAAPRGWSLLLRPTARITRVTRAPRTMPAACPLKAVALLSWQTGASVCKCDVLGAARTSLLIRLGMMGLCSNSGNLPNQLVCPCMRLFTVIVRLGKKSTNSTHKETIGLIQQKHQMPPMHWNILEQLLSSLPAQGMGLGYGDLGLKRVFVPAIASVLGCFDADVYTRDDLHPPCGSSKTKALL